MSESSDNQKPVNSDRDVRRRRGSEQQTNIQRLIATALEGQASASDRNSNIPLHANSNPLLQSSNLVSSTNQLAATLAAQHLFLQQLELISQPRLLYTRSISGGSASMHGQQNNTPVHSPYIANISNTGMLNVSELPFERSAHYHVAPTANATTTSAASAPGNHEEKVSAEDSSHRRLSRSKLVKPKRPLSAYNFFFQEERAKIIGQREHDSCKDSQADSSSAKKNRYQPNGTGFEDLAKEISKRWKNIDNQRLAECTRRAEDDTQRYQAELAVYNELREKSLSALQQAQEASVSDEVWEQYLAAAESQKPSRKRKTKTKKRERSQKPDQSL